MLLPTNIVAYDLSIGIFTFDRGVIKVKVMYNFTVNISQTVTGQTFLLARNEKSHVGFRVLDLNLILAYSKGQLVSYNGMLPNIWPSCFFYNQLY